MKRYVAVGFFLLICAASAFACSCVPFPPDKPRTPRAVAEWRSKGADVIFAGTVEQLEVTGWPLQPVPGKTVSTETKLKVTFSNALLYRGTPRQRYILETGLGGGDCGYPFRQGRAYLVYGHMGDGELHTGICTGTKLLDTADPDQRFLRGEPAWPEDLMDFEDRRRDSRLGENASWPKVCGKVSLPQNVKPQPITVRAWQVGDDALSVLKGDETDTEGDGTFCLKWFEPGEYIIAAVTEERSNTNFRYLGYYPGVDVRGNAKKVTFPQTGVLRTDFALARQNLYTVRGYLRGAPQTKDRIMIMLLSNDLNAFTLVEPASLKSNSLFDFARIPAGRYSAFAFTQDDENETMTFVSTVADIDVQGNYEGLKLEFVVPNR